MALKKPADLKESSVEFTVYLRKEGKITVPKEVRDAMGLTNGDLIRAKIVKVQAG
jgi:bifunctional DNA-binding transcriptional regulator/antitoxin component of YhaV-PrlF toxin-antitoxin module